MIMEVGSSLQVNIKQFYEKTKKVFNNLSRYDKIIVEYIEINNFGYKIMRRNFTNGKNNSR